MRNRFCLLIVATLFSSTVFAGDFRSATWGMTKEEVKRVEKTTIRKEASDELEYEGQVADVKASILYKFKGNRLIEGVYIFPGMLRLDPNFPIDPSGKSSRPNPYEDHYKVHAYLVTKYGKPVTERQWEETRGKSKIKNSASYWSMDKSLISHVLSVADNGMFVAHVNGYFPVLERPKELSDDSRNLKK